MSTLIAEQTNFSKDDLQKFGNEIIWLEQHECTAMHVDGRENTFYWSKWQPLFWEI